MIEAYGGKCECCGASDNRVLALRKELAVTGSTRSLTYTDLRRLGWPKDGYKLLCMNCLMSVVVHGYCPHNGVPERVISDRKGRYKEKARSMIFREYGGKCVLCGEDRKEFLVLDHVNGGGNNHRKLVKKKGLVDFCVLAKSEGWPKDKYRLLCFSCNHNSTVGIIQSKQPISPQFLGDTS